MTPDNEAYLAPPPGRQTCQRENRLSFQDLRMTAPPAPPRSGASLPRQLSLLLACVLAALWGLVIWNHHKTEEEAQAALRRQTAIMALAFSEHTESTFQRVDYALFQLRDAWLNKPDSFPSAIAKHLLLLGDAVHQIGIIDANGLLVFSNRGGTGLNLSDREHFRAHVQGGNADRLFVSRPLKGRASGKWSIQLTRPIYDRDRFAGVIVLSVDPGYFVRFYQKIDLGEQGLVVIVRDSGEIMARSIGMEQHIGKVVSTSPYTDPGAPSRGDYRRRSQADGIERITSYFRMPDYGVNLIIGAGIEEQLKPVRSQQKLVLMIAGSASLLLALMFWQLLRGIAGREKAERSVHEGSETLRSILDTTLDGFWHIDAQGRLLDVNPAYCQQSGYCREALLGMQIADLEVQESAAETETHIRRVIENGRDQFETRHRRQDGSIWHVEVSTTYREGQFCAFVRDISARKQAEAALQKQTEALARSNAELEQFAYVASHDLRQPLRMVRSYVQMLERRLADKLDAPTREMMHFAADGATRMDQMLVALLEYSRVGRKGEPLVAFASRTGVDEALQFLAPLIREAKATVRISGDWPEILASRDEFTRLWQNLIGNALKYRAANRSPELDITVAPDADGWRFCVADNGIGIDPAQFDRLFKVFQRLHSREQYEGTGIGLAVARKIVERHDGRIWVESDGAGLGCRFCFYLPTQRAAEDKS